MKDRPLIWLFAAATLAGCSASATALDFGVRHYGARGGVSMNPDQFLGGFFMDAGRLTSSVRLQPSFELGLGNGVRLGAANLDALYPISVGRSFRPYFGGGMGVNFIDVTSGVGEARGLEIDPVVNVVGGLEWGFSRHRTRAPFRYVLEARLGIGTTPDFKIAAGITF